MFLCGTERLAGNSFLVGVERRDADTLFPITERYICPGSDEWKAYCGMQGKTGQSYTHITVDHSLNFVVPDTGANT